jgi:hypothetical protein
MNAMIAVPVLANDTSANGVISISTFGQATHGAVSIGGDGQSLIYTPRNNFIGSDSFNYTISDNTGNSDLAIVYVRVQAPSDLVLHWQFDEVEGYFVRDNAHDKDAGIHDGDGIQETAIRVPGKLGNALSLEGSNFVILGESTDWQIQQMTISLWIKPNVSISQMNTYTSLFHSLDYVNNTGFYFGTLGNSNELHFMLMNGGSVEDRKIVTSPENSVGEWVHVAVVYDGDSMIIYRNGSVSASAQVGSLAINYSPNNWPLLVGQYFNGQIDDYRMYSRSLSASEIQGLSGATPNNAAPVISMGENQIITLPQVANINPIINDDGLPVNSLSYQWRLVNGPALVQFSQPNAPSTSVSFAKDGGYSLRLIASDGELDSYADIYVTAYANDSLEDGLLAHWKLDENSGSIATDSSGNGFDSGLQNNPTWQSGTIGGAISLNGYQYGVTQDAQALRLDQFSISAWLFNRTSTADMTGEFPMILSKQDWINNAGFHFGVLEPNTNTIGFRMLTEGSIYSRKEVQAPFATFGKWAHMASVYNGVSLRLYIDGILSNEMQTGPIRMNQSGSPLYLGHEIDGLMDDVRIYERPLNPSEIQTLVQGGVSGNG